MTPLQQQYNKIKSQHPDSILFFRMGDFYEGFDEDAKVMAKVLGIALTSRSKKEKRPMAGIPHHALDAYLFKLVKAGYKVAVCEQLEAPKKGVKIVKREVVKIITPGTITDEKVVDVTSANYIAALNIRDEKIGIAFADVNTGEFKTTEFGIQKQGGKRKLIDEINRLSPSEILINKNEAEKIKTEFKPISKYYIQELDDEFFDEENAEKILKEFFQVSSLKGFGIENRSLCTSSSGALVNYLTDTQKNALSHINSISFYNLGNRMLMDSATMKNLELVYSFSSGSKNESLLGVLDKTQTTMGARLLRSWILQPLIDEKKIRKRLEAVDAYFKQPEENDKVRTLLSEIYDLERLAGKIGSAGVNPKDLIALKQSLTNAPNLAKNIPANKYLNKIKEEIETNKFDELINLLQISINDNPPMSLNEGGIIKEKYDEKLDEIRNAARGGKDWIKSLQIEEINRTGISSLKVKFNKIFGYYIEVSNTNLKKVPGNYIRKQTLVNAERFITPELKEMEEKILGAEEKMINLEYKIFTQIREECVKYIKDIQNLAKNIAILDVIANFAYLARYENFVKPEINGKGIIKIKDGRHPVVEKLSENPFIPNDILLNKDTRQLIILTGPNMAGKSTYIRQAALIVLMAQIGCFVPAKAAKIAATDRIFTRVGASDNLAGGESTFMVEMNETANILNNATEKSLLILDEVGRGTSTYDGVSIAWAVAEHIHNKIGAFTLFATHYHELIKLENILKKVKNYNVAVKEDGENVIFLRKIVEGGTDQSYGVHVAEMAGIPKDVILKAREILSGFEQENMFAVRDEKFPNDEKIDKNEELKNSKKRACPFPQNQMPLFATDARFEKIKTEIRKIDIDNMTPFDALRKLKKIRDKFAG